MSLRIFSACLGFAAILGTIAVTHAEVLDERQQMLNGGSPRNRGYNLFGFTGSELSRSRVSFTGDYKPGFFVRLFQKDLRLAIEANMATGVTMPVTSIVTQFVNSYVAAGGGELDCAAAVPAVVSKAESRASKGSDLFFRRLTTPVSSPIGRLRLACPAGRPRHFTF